MSPQKQNLINRFPGSPLKVNDYNENSLGGFNSINSKTQRNLTKSVDLAGRGINRREGSIYSRGTNNHLKNAGITTIAHKNITRDNQSENK